MSKENVRRFYAELAKESVLQRKFGELNARLSERYGGAAPDEKELEAVFRSELLPALREAGFDFAYADLKEYAEDASVGELADEELAAVVGGVACVCVAIGAGNNGESTFGCLVSGFITSDELTCFCVFGGGGK